MSGKEKKKDTGVPNFDFLLEPTAQFENRVSPTDDAKQRFSMEDPNHRHVTGQQVWDLYRSVEFRARRAARVRESLAVEETLDAPELTHG